MGSVELPPFQDLHKLGLQEDLRGVNTELRCFILGALPLDRALTTGEISERIRTEVNGSCMNPNVDSHHLGRMAAYMPDEHIEVVKDPDTNRLMITKTERGEAAAGLGGAIMRACVDRNIPILRLIGKTNNKNGDSASATESVNSRLAILSILYEKAWGKWVASDELIETGAELGQSDNTVAKQLASLADSGIIEKTSDDRKVKRNGHWQNRFRIPLPESDDGASPGLAIENYLEVVANFAVGNERVLQAGRSYLDLLMTDHARMPYLVRRACLSSGHIGPSNPNGSKR